MKLRPKGRCYVRTPAAARGEGRGCGPGSWGKGQKCAHCAPNCVHQTNMCVRKERGCAPSTAGTASCSVMEGGGYLLPRVLGDQEVRIRHGHDPVAPNTRGTSWGKRYWLRGGCVPARGRGRRGRWCLSGPGPRCRQAAGAPEQKRPAKMHALRAQKSLPQAAARRAAGAAGATKTGGKAARTTANILSCVRAQPRSRSRRGKESDAKNHPRTVQTRFEPKQRPGAASWRSRLQAFLHAARAIARVIVFWALGGPLSPRQPSRSKITKCAILGKLAGGHL